MLGWTVDWAVIGVWWMSSGNGERLELPHGEQVIVGGRFAVTLVTLEPATFEIDNRSVSSETFDYTNLKMVDSAGAEHEPILAPAELVQTELVQTELVQTELVQTLGVSESISGAFDFGDGKSAEAVSYYWECYDCQTAESVGRVFILIMFGGLYVFGMILLFMIWLMKRPP